MALERILIVDDEPYVRTVMAAMLEKSSYSPVLAANGLEAIQRLVSDPPYDLILSDIMMTGLDGIGLLERVREVQPDTPMVMVTAIHDISVAITAMRNGAYDYLLKPFERDQLLATVKRALEYRRLVQQNSVYRYNLEQLVTARTEMLRHAMTDLERSYDITLEALGDALDLRDAETEGHSKRVTAYTIALSRAMEVPPEHIRTMARGAFLHDIGKMAIPDAILLKAGKLDHQEQAMMREHCARGYQMLRKIPVPARCRGNRLQPSGALRRQRIPPRPDRRSDSPRRANLCRCRYPGRHHLRPAVPPGENLRRRPAGDRPLLRHAVRSEGREGLSGYAQPAMGGPAAGDQSSWPLLTPVLRRNGRDWW